MNEAYYFWTAEQVARYIKKHQEYIFALVVRIEDDLARLVIANGFKHPQLLEAHNLFLVGSRKMEVHLKKELITILPFAKRYAKALKKGKRGKPGLQSACPGIHKMYEEHKHRILPFHLIAHKLRNVEISEKDKPLYDNICRNLTRLRQRWQEQLHLENDVLFPKIIE